MDANISNGLLVSQVCQYRSLISKRWRGYGERARDGDLPGKMGYEIDSASREMS